MGIQLSYVLVPLPSGDKKSAGRWRRGHEGYGRQRRSLRDGTAVKTWSSIAGYQRVLPTNGGHRRGMGCINEKTLSISQWNGDTDRV